MDPDRELFLEVPAGTAERFGWICYAYCLMTNHFHLLIETSEANLSRGMRHLNGVYTQAFNRRHIRVGHVLQGRFKSIVVEKESHLLELARYVVLNPVRAKMIRSAKDWPWSSHRATAGLEEAPAFLAVDRILAQFHKNQRRAIELYRDFVKAGCGAEVWSELRGEILLGSDEFVHELKPLLSDHERVKELPWRERLTAPESREAFRQGPRQTNAGRTHPRGATRPRLHPSGSWRRRRPPLLDRQPDRQPRGFESEAPAPLTLNASADCHGGRHAVTPRRR